MKINIIIIFILYSFSAFSQQKENINIFINNFKETSFPIDTRNIFVNNKNQISDIFVKKFLCDNISECFYIHSRYKLSYFYIAKFNISKKFYLILYEKALIDSRYGERKYIMCSISKRTKKIISKISLKVINQNGFYLYSTINENLEIDTYKLYTEGKEAKLKPDPLQPSFFWIDELSCKYKISKKGKFIQISNYEENRYIGRLGISEQEGFYVYPVSLPKK